MAKHNFRTSVRNGDIIQGDTRPSEIVTYRLSAEELARYGPPAEAKRCTKCGEDKPLDQYHKGQTMCKACRKAYDAERMRKARAAKAAAVAAEEPAEIPAPAIADAIPLSADLVTKAVRDYVARKGMTLEVTGPGTLVIANVYAAVDLLDEGRRYKLTMSVEEA